MTKDTVPEKTFSLLHTNISSLTGNGDKLEYTLNQLEFKFDIIAITESWECKTNEHMFNPIILTEYNDYEGQPGSTRNGGCGLYINKDLDYIPRNGLDSQFHKVNSEFEMKWIEVIEEKNCNKIIGVIYRHPNNKDIEFNSTLAELLQNISRGKNK